MKNNLLARFCGLLCLVQLLVLTATSAFAQAADPNAPEMADALRHDGKIYVVVAAVVIIVAGLLVYLISLDRKVSKLEEEIKK